MTVDRILLTTTRMILLLWLVVILLAASATTTQAFVPLQTLSSSCMNRITCSYFTPASISSSSSSSSSRVVSTSIATTITTTTATTKRFSTFCAAAASAVSDDNSNSNTKNPSNSTDVQLIQKSDTYNNNDENDKSYYYNTNIGKKRLASGMAFVTGWADLAMVSQWKTFGSMMTGNTMWCAKACVEQRWMDVVYYLTVILSYWIGLACFRVSQVQYQSATTTNNNYINNYYYYSKHLKRLGGMVATVFGLAGLLVVQNGTSRSLLMAAQRRPTFALVKWIPACLVASGFGMANAVGSDTASTMTFVVTGHMTKLATTLTDLLILGKQQQTTTTPTTALDVNTSSNDSSNQKRKENLLKTFWKTPGVILGFSVTGSFFAGAFWAALFHWTKTKWVQRGSAAAYAWITATWGVDFGVMGLVLLSLFCWKDWISKQPPKSVDMD